MLRPLAFVLLAACSGGSTQPGGADKGVAAPEAATIKIGEYGSMTGSEATFGQSTHNGIVLAIEEVNARGGVKGKQIELKSYDDQGKTQEAGTVVTRLVTEDQVVAILGEVASSLSIAGGRVAQQYGVPMISPSSTNAKVTEVGDRIFRVCFVDEFQGFVGAKFAAENLKVTKAATLYDQGSAYSKGLKDDFAKAFVAMGGEVVTEQAYTAGDQDFSAQLGTIKASGIQVVYLPGYYTDVGNIAIQARKLGIEVPMLGGDGWDSAKLAEIGGPAIEGSFYSNHYAPEEDRPEVQAFVKAYQARYSAVPDGLAALGYDAARVLFAAMERSPDLGGEALSAAISQTKDFPGVTGSITIDGKRNAQKPAVVVEMKGGSPHFVASVAPEGGKGGKAKGEKAEGEHADGGPDGEKGDKAKGDKAKGDKAKGE
jgi:branched-chain amino acid transport system substrate-binding protein